MLSKIETTLKKSNRELLNVLESLQKATKGREVTKKLKSFTVPYKLHLGCGGIKFEDFVNIDMSEGSADVIWNLAWGIPAPDNSCHIIYHEHFLEHLSVEQGLSFLSECYRVLKPGGVMRIAMPSLDTLLTKSSSDDWRKQPWLSLPEYQFIETRAEMLNIAFRWWGHQWLYDREELYRRLNSVGFNNIRDVEWRESDIPALVGRESREDSRLICEVSK